MAAKTICPISRKEFDENAKPIEVIINGTKMKANNRQFSTGSLGWNISSKMEIEVGGKTVTVQVGLNLTIVGSKELPGAKEITKEAPAASSGSGASEAGA